ncbi:hypothetical protein [Elizabethkingia anophelis]|uniref:hypothetical protein n=1 Tax=Elizabethkingia anophelis TaxID=1117645 RepID=UPI0022273D8A|nr:hypothetical protein [Elizabethkingia anophelis]MCW2463365.1 hypothetical protein [Elizabethkingia anophelis]MCW2467050.1 hypothetical protein [Elizabethkingia anophelis]MCW2470802.1 hypothetical protein [Elizabethkingia anophelis]HBI9690674.1 hypothetical protein [Elizabethkingia anophelis]HBI9694693.1 hypothetical protein [Elizabethkingia anophelis]
MGNKKRIQKQIQKLKIKQWTVDAILDLTCYEVRKPVFIQYGRSRAKTFYINKLKSIYSDNIWTNREYIHNFNLYPYQSGIISSGKTFRGQPVYTSYLKEDGFLFEIDFIKDDLNLTIIKEKTTRLCI